MEEYMVDRDIVYAKIGIVQRCLKRIQQSTGLDPAVIDDFDKQDIFVLNLQRAVQATIDLAAHVTASEGLGMPEELKDNFRFLKEKNIISFELSAKMEKMIGFRNIAVHEYREIDPDILKVILTKNLKDLEDFYVAVVNYFRLSDK